jgi:hypothetical protein
MSRTLRISNSAAMRWRRHHSPSLGLASSRVRSLIESVPKQLPPGLEAAVYSDGGGECGEALICPMGCFPNPSVWRHEAQIGGCGWRPHGDVRTLCRERHGGFDTVLWSGILYHRDAPDVTVFIDRIGEVCERCVILDTHVSFRARESFEHRELTHWGSRFIEHHKAATAQERESSSWASPSTTRRASGSRGPLCLTRSPRANY